MNKYRITAHHIVFFIFIVSNVGGCLTPIGDPPLFLGYLKGIPFWWVAEHCWPMWAVGVGFLLALFYIIDPLNYRRAPKEVRERLAEPPDQWRFEGLWNLAFLLVILGAVFINRPLFLREALMVGAAAGSWFTTRKHVHEANHFNFHPIQEVAILFIGIFATMMPALDWLQQQRRPAGHTQSGLFYWGSGMLSSVLDNAPTYLSFLSAAFGLFVDPDIIDKVQLLVQEPRRGPGRRDRTRTPRVSGTPSRRCRNTTPDLLAGGKVERGANRGRIPARQHRLQQFHPRHQRRRGVLRRQHLHRQRPQFHGQSHRRPTEGSTRRASWATSSNTPSPAWGRCCS